MDLYTLTENFLAKDVVDEFVSAIWTERYSAAGDVQLVVPATPENQAKLAEGTFLALRGSKEVMILETQKIQKGLMTVVGGTLPTFLNQRFSWFANPDSSAIDVRIVDYSDKTKKPGEFLADVVNKLVINPTPFAGAWAPANLDWDFDKIPHLSLGAVDVSGVAERLTLPIGPLYDGLAQLASQLGVGFSLYLESANEDTGYVLKFTTYRGVDRTGDQTVNELVRLIPEMDGVTDLTEINSMALYKNVAYVYYKGIVTQHLAEPTLPAPEGFARRVLVVNPVSQPVGHPVTMKGYWQTGQTPYTAYVVDEADIAAFREQVAQDALANNNYIRAVDGKTSSSNEYQYGVHYGLGDVIELEGLTGTTAKARVTEYIRSQDKSGERNYPTIAVVS